MDWIEKWLRQCLTSIIHLCLNLDSYLGGIILEAGSETTTSFLRSLIIALIEYPEIQRKAQEEIDRVIGNDRAPTLEDFADLPYIQALIKEVSYMDLSVFAYEYVIRCIGFDLQYPWRFLTLIW